MVSMREPLRVQAGGGVRGRSGMPTKVFFVEAIDMVMVSLRRYSIETDCISRLACGALRHGYCDASTPLGEEPALFRSDGVLRERPPVSTIDPGWPTACEHCGKAFKAFDHWQVFQDRMYARLGTGERWPLRELPPGAVYDAHWMHERKEWCGPDGRSLHVILPNGATWAIDSRASNCDMPKDTSHKCWVRHGKPEDGTLHVDKNGKTCGAGAGSIQAGDYHGFLHGGVLT